MNNYLNLFIILCSLCMLGILTSCQQQPTKPLNIVSEHTPINVKPPRITGITDLGGLDIALGGGIPIQYSDGRFSPGEWILINGANLGAKFVSIDGIEIPINSYYGKNPLIQIPTQLKPLKTHTINLQTELGSADINFHTSHYIAATDTDDKKIHLIRTNPQAKGGVEEEWIELEGDMDRPMFALMSPDSRFLFAINIKKEIPEIYSGLNAYQIEILTYHLANPNKPMMISNWTVDIGSSPIDATMGSDGTLLLLGKRSFTLVNTNNAKNLQLIGSKRLPDNDKRTTYVDAVFLNQHQQIAVLETHSNSVYLFAKDATKEFPLLHSLKLQPSKSIPLSVDLEVDSKNDSEFWVLEGPNYRLSGDATHKLYKTILNKDKEDESKSYINQMQKVIVSSTKMSLGKTLSLPENYVAFFSKFGQDGLMYLTMTKFDFLNAEFESENLSSKNFLKKISGFLWDSISVGRVISLNTETGKVETVANGVGLYYDIIDVPDIGPVFSLLKFGPSFSFPFLTPSWGLGIKSTGTYAKRKMSGRAIFPPYSVGFVAFQH